MEFPSRHVLLICCFFVLMVCYSSVTAEPAHRLCGHKLVTTLLKLCNNCVYNPEDELYRNRRDGRSHQRHHGADDLVDGQYAYAYTVDNMDIRLRKHHPKQHTQQQFVDLSRGKRQGIAERCCRHTCTYTELLNYCCRTTSQDPTRLGDADQT